MPMWMTAALRYPSFHIPGEETILLKKKPGDTVNLECDLIGKYVEKLLFGKAEETQKSSGGITEAFLAENGFM